MGLGTSKARSVSEYLCIVLEIIFMKVSPIVMFVR